MVGMGFLRRMWILATSLIKYCWQDSSNNNTTNPLIPSVKEITGYNNFMTQEQQEEITNLTGFILTCQKLSEYSIKNVYNDDRSKSCKLVFDGKEYYVPVAISISLTDTQELVNKLNATVKPIFDEMIVKSKERITKILTQ